MSADAYLQQILNREAVDTEIFSPVRGVRAILEPTIREANHERSNLAHGDR